MCRLAAGAESGRKVYVRQRIWERKSQWNDVACDNSQERTYWDIDTLVMDGISIWPWGKYTTMGLYPPLVVGTIDAITVRKTGKLYSACQCVPAPWTSLNEWSWISNPLTKVCHRRGPENYWMATWNSPQSIVYLSGASSWLGARRSLISCGSSICPSASPRSTVRRMYP